MMGAAVATSMNKRHSNNRDDDEIEDISPPESIGDFRRNGSSRGSRKGDSSDAGSVEGMEVRDRSSPSSLYPNVGKLFVWF
jgi:hypothetical protein